MAVQLGGNALNYFQAGQAGGAASSPVSGMGSAIRGILGQARKTGLINTQAQGNYDTAVGAAQYKQQSDAPIGFPGGVVPKVREENGMLITPEYDDRGRATGGLKYTKKAPDTIYTFMGDDDTTPNDPTKPVQASGSLSEADAYQLYLQMKQ